MLWPDMSKEVGLQVDSIEFNWNHENVKESYTIVQDSIELHRFYIQMCPKRMEWMSRRQIIRKSVLTRRMIEKSVLTRFIIERSVLTRWTNLEIHVDETDSWEIHVDETDDCWLQWHHLAVMSIQQTCGLCKATQARGTWTLQSSRQGGPTDIKRRFFYYKRHILPLTTAWGPTRRCAKSRRIGLMSFVCMRVLLKMYISI